MSKKRIYAEISKVEAQDDGTLHVSGYASSNAVDSDGETITTEAMRAALPDYMKFGAVREMHQPLAAGTALSASIEESTGKTLFSAHVVDPVACLKVTSGVYKGFSIGGKVTSRDPMDKKVIKGLNLIEVSLVDRPANPEAVFKLAKAETTPEDDITELAELLDAGTVTPAQVLELIKASKEPAPVAEPVVDATPAPVVPDTVQKGMYSVSGFAQLLASIGYLAEDVSWESQYEGDNSPLPAAMLAWLKAGFAIFKDMVAEEAQELVASVSAAANLPEVIQMQSEKLGKKGATFSKSTKEALGKIHAACKEASAHLDGLGYADDAADDADADKAAKLPDTEATPSAPDQTVAKTVQADTIGIVPTPDTSELVKTELAKAIAPLNEAIEKAGKENAELKAKLEELSKRAAPGKALLKAVVSITKATDSAPVETVADTAPIPAEGTTDRAAYEMRKVFQTGGRRLA